MFWYGIVLGVILGVSTFAFIQAKLDSKYVKLWTWYGEFAVIRNTGIGGVLDSYGNTHNWGSVEKDYPLDDDRNAWYGKNQHYVAWKYKQMEPTQ